MPRWVRLILVVFSLTDGGRLMVVRRTLLRVAETQDINALSGVLAQHKGGFGVDVSFDTGDPEAARSVVGAASSADVSALLSRVSTLESPRSFRVLDTDNAADGLWVVRDDDHGKTLFVIGGTADQIDIQLHGSTAGDDLYRSGVEVGIHVYGTGAITLAWPSGVTVGGVAGASSVALVRESTVVLQRNPSSNLWNLSGNTA